MSNLPYKLLDTSSLNLQLDTNLPQFAVLSEVLAFHGIPFKVWTSDDGTEVNSIDLCFTRYSKFANVYLLAYIFKDFGLELVFPTKKLSPAIQLGANLSLLEFPERMEMLEPISVDDFLKLDPKLDSQYVIENYFKKIYSAVVLDEGELGDDDDPGGDFDDGIIWKKRD